MKGKPHRRVLWILCALLAAVAGCAIGVMATKKSAEQNIARIQNSARQQHPLQHITDTLPPIVSKIKKIKVVSATIKNQGQRDAMAVIELQNDSDKAVTAITLTFDEVSIGKGSGIASDNPIMWPHGTTVIEFPLSNLEKDVPVLVGGVIYADNTEDGEDIVLEVMHKQRDMEKAKRAAQKGMPEQ